MDTLDRLYITGIGTIARFMLNGVLSSKSNTLSPIPDDTPVEQSSEQAIEQQNEAPRTERQSLDPETMRYQVQQTRNELWLLENHLKTACKGCGADNTCCFKHSTNAETLARETQSMTTDALWDEIAETAREVRAKVHPRDIRSGKYANEYPSLIIKVAELRKAADDQLLQL